MTNELILIAARLNLSISAAILLVLFLRMPLRRWCGADLAYSLWTLVPVVAVADLMVSAFALKEASLAAVFLPGWTPPPLPEWSGKVWLSGAGAGLALMAVTHIVTLFRVRAGKAGPAVIGLFRPRLCLPVDFTQRFTPNEQRLIRAHERAHLIRNDILANAAMSLLRCVLWFNPFVHLAAIAMRADQELACDAEVMDEYPDQRRRYAQALLKAQIGPRGEGVAFGSHPLETRIAAVVRGSPNAYPRLFGLILVAAGGMFLLRLYIGSIGLDAGDLVHLLLEFSPPAA